MEGEARSRKADYGRDKHGPLSLRKRAFQDKKVKSESLTYSSSGSIGEKSLDGMIVVGKGCHFTKSRSYDSAHFLHEYHSEAAIHPVSSDTKLRDSAPGEGLDIGIPAYHSVSSTSFTSAKSDLSNTADALQKRIQEMENEISSKNATIHKLKREMGKGGSYECKSTSVETDLTFEIMEDYEKKLKDLSRSIGDRDKKISDLTLKLEETVKAKSLQAEENKGLTHEINLLNRQLQSMHELIHSQKWESPTNVGDLKEVAKYKTRITELEFTLSKQDALLKELNRTLEKHDFSLKTKEKELKAKSQELFDYKSKSTLEIRKLMNQIDTLEKGTSKKKKEDLEEYKENVMKISNLPRNVIERIMSLCETGEINTVKNVAEQRETYERKLSSIREEHENEIKRLTDIHDSKLNFLKKEIEMLHEQLRERNGMLETYESELSLYRSGVSVIPKDEDLSSLKEIFNAEIESQKQIHKIEMDLFEEKVKRLSEDILYRAKNEEVHLQELQSAKETANTFKEKYEQLLEQWEEKTKENVLEGTFLDQMELDDIVEHFKKLTATLKQTEEIHEEKVKHLQKLHDDEIAIYQREVDLFRMKLEQVDRFQTRQVELDDEVKELIRNVEFKFTKTTQSMAKSHEMELKLKQTELEAMERRYLEEINILKEKQQVEIDNLKKNLLKTEERGEVCLPEYNMDEIKLLKCQVEELTVELLKCEGMIAMKEEIENALIGRIKELEDLIKFKEDQCRKELEDLLSKYMKVQTLLSAKEEIAKELEDRLKQTETLLEKSRSETEELDRTCVKLKENLQNLEMQQKKEESKVHFLESNRDDQHDPVDHSEKASIECQVDIPKVDSLETLQYLLRVGELEKENEDLKNEIDHLKNGLIEMDIEKDFTFKELEKVKSKSSIHNELIVKYKNIQEELEDVKSQKNILQSLVKSLEDEQTKLLAEVKVLKESNLKIQFSDEENADDLKREIERLKDEIKMLNEKIEALTTDNENLQMEVQKHRKTNQELKNELEEAWAQHCEIEDQLAEVKKENALLNLHRNQLEKTNKRISSLVNEGSPSIVSWLKIHETVENIVDDVLALKTSFGGESSMSKNSVNKTKSELKLLTESLNLQLEHKTKLCNELMTQKKSLEKELVVLEELLRQSEKNLFNQKSKYERELRNRNLAIRRLHLELESKQFLERAWEKKMDLKMRLAIDDHQLEKIKHSTEETYMMTKVRLKKHFEDQQKSREAHLKEALSHEIKLLKKEINNLEDEVRKKDKALNEKMDTEKEELEKLRVKYQEEIDHLTGEHKVELEKLRSMLSRMQETGNSSLIIHKMEEEHAKAMEELRTYYEKKCADLEKQYSEEVYRQQSRKMSICSSMSESEFPIDLDSTESVNHITEQIENKKRERILENYRNIFDEEEEIDEKKKKLENFLQDVLNGHNKEMNYLHVKYNKEICNLEAKHTSEMNRINLELSETRKNIEIEKKIFDISLNKELRKNLADAIRSEIKEKYEKEKNGRIDDLLEKMRMNCRKEMKSLEDICVEELSRCQADSAISKVESVEKMRNEKDLEMEQVVNFYRSLYEAALSKFEERQEQAIKNQKEVIEDYEKQIQELKEAHRIELEQYSCEERNKWEQFRSREKELESELSSIKSTYEDELLELRKCCQDTLQEQVNLAKADALNSLQQQIQEFLQREDGEDLTSKELLELEEKFAGKYRKEIEELKQKHHGEVTRLRSEFEERIMRRYSTGSMPKRCLLNDMKTDDDKLEIIRERDALKDTVGSLRHVLTEFVRYIGICEDELNSSLVGEIRQADETMYKSFKLDNGLNDTDCSITSIISKRVHFAPDLSGIMSSINESSLLNASMQIRMELDKCLKQLKNDANCLLAMSNPSRKHREDVDGILKKLEVEKSHLEEKVCAVEELTKDLKVEVDKTKEKLSEWERNREVVSEGFGEEVISPQKLATLSELKNKARSLMTTEQCNHPSNIMSILEEICKEGDRLQEESRREKLDLQQQEGCYVPVTVSHNQIEAADKQIKIFKKFVEEQAAEREQERDEFLNEINRLVDALKVKERDSSLKERTNEEVEALENQLKDAQAQLGEAKEKKDEAEKKLKEAIDKIWSLREIIQDLEKQIAVGSQKEVDLQRKIKDLEDIIDHQNEDNQMIVTELESIKSQNNAEMSEYVRNLEEELINLRRIAEQTSPEAISQMKTTLRDIESSLVRKTKELEQLHASSANVSCSSPSEDVSIREHLDATRCPTPDEMHCHDESRGSLLFEEIERINEKLIRHNRAEEVALKSIRDLKMQLKSTRKTLDEIQTERDVLLDRVELYLQENSSLKARLDEQRCNAGVIQRQLSHELEAQIKRLEEDIEKLNNLCLQKDKQIRDMNAILEQTTKSLQIRETEVLNKSKEENVLITRLKTDLQNVLAEKAQLEEKLKKMSEKVRDNATLPVLVDAMLEEKNAEIDQLKNEVLRLSGTRAVSSLINSKMSSESMNSRRVKFSEPDSFIEFISPILPENVSVVRSAGDSYADLKISSHRLYKPLVCISTPESLSSIGPLQLSPRGLEPRRQSGWTNQQKSVNSTEQNMTDDLVSLKKQLSEKTEELKKCESQLSERSAVDNEIGEIRNQLQSTMAAVEEDKQFYKKQFEQMLKTEAELQNEVDSKRREISEQLIELDTLRQNLMEKTDELDCLKLKYDEDIAEKNKEIEKLKINCQDLEREIENLKEAHADESKELKNQLNFEKTRVDNALKEINLLEMKKVEIEEEFLSLKKDYNEKLTAELKSNSKLKNEISELQSRNSELGKQFAKVKFELESALKDAEKMSKEFGSELSGVREENKKLKDDYLNLQNNLESCMNIAKSKEEASVQARVDADEKSCQTYENVEMTLVPIKKYDQCDEFSEFQENIQKLRYEISAWEEKMDKNELKKDEALSFLALVRTLLTCIVDNLDDHFYELETYRKKMMECSVDDLTDRVQRELLLSAKLDNELLSSFQKAAVKPGEEELDENLAGDNLIIPKQSNFINVTVRISELEANLQDEMERNNELKNQVDALKSEKEELVKRIEKQKKFIVLLEDSLLKEKKKVAIEKSRYEEDARIMEALRVNFESSLEKIEKLEEELNKEKQEKAILEKQLKASEKYLQMDSENRIVSDFKCQLDAERQKIISLGINVEKEKRKCQELRAALEREKLERMSEKDVQRLMGSDLALLQEQKENLENQLSNAREMLKTRGEEVAALKRKINLLEIDIKALAISNEHQQDKDSDYSIMVERIRGLEQELDFYRSEVHALAEKPEKGIPQPLLLKMKNLNNCVEQHVVESNEMGEALLHLTQETEQMKTLIKKLEESTEQNSGKSGDDTLLADVEMERQSWMSEKEKLISELETIKAEYEILKQTSLETFKNNDVQKLEIKKLNKEIENLKEEISNHAKTETQINEGRVVHLFGKYMRAESYRKALSWQKRYLMLVISSYEETEEETWMKLNRLANKRKDFKKHNVVKTKRRTLKGAAMVVVAIKRMQFMVKRWRHGRIAGVQAILGHQETTPSKNKTVNRPASTISLLNGPIDPLSYQTQNFIRPRSQPSPIEVRKPLNRDIDLKNRLFSPTREVAQCRSGM